MCVVLNLFKAISGLKVNFTKSQLYVVNVQESWLNKAVLVLKCKVENLPFVYLGLPIGGDARRLSFWKSIELNLDCQGGNLNIYLSEVAWFC